MWFSLVKLGSVEMKGVWRVNSLSVFYVQGGTGHSELFDLFSLKLTNCQGPKPWFPCCCFPLRYCPAFHLDISNHPIPYVNRNMSKIPRLILTVSFCLLLFFSEWNSYPFNWNYPHGNQLLYLGQMISKFMNWWYNLSINQMFPANGRQLWMEDCGGRTQNSVLTWICDGLKFGSMPMNLYFLL